MKVNLSLGMCKRKKDLVPTVLINSSYFYIPGIWISMFLKVCLIHSEPL